MLVLDTLTLSPMELTQKLLASSSGTQEDPPFFYLPVSNSGTKIYLTLIDLAFLSLPHKNYI